MAQVSDIEQSIPEIKLKYMMSSGNTYIFTDDKSSWIDMEKIVHLCSTPDTDK